MILSVSKQLCDLTFSQYILKNNSKVSDFNLPRASYTSSTLTKLSISVHYFDDCLYLLDGRFECLSTLVIKITAVLDKFSNRENTVSRIAMSSFEEICLKNLSIFFFSLEKTSSIKVFLVVIGRDDILLRQTNCSTPSSNVKSRRIDIISYSIKIGFDFY